MEKVITRLENDKDGEKSVLSWTDWDRLDPLKLAHSYSNHLIIDKSYNGYWFQVKMEVNISHWNLQDMIAILKIKDVFLVMEWKMKHCIKPTKDPNIYKEPCMYL